MSLRCCVCLLLVVMAWIEDVHVDGAKILISPMTGGVNSRLRNLQFIGRLLKERGHDVHVIIPVLEPGLIEKAAPDLRYWSYELSGAPHIGDERMLTLITEGNLNRHIPELVRGLIGHCESFLQGGLLWKLGEERFDLLIQDNMDVCNQLIINYLDVPTIMYANYAYGYDLTKYHIGSMNPAHSPSAYQPSTDRMAFKERLLSSIDYIANELFTYYVDSQLSALQVKYQVSTSVPLHTARDKVSLVFCNADFAFDYPRALMPNVINIGGLHFKPAKPLKSSTILDFVNGASEHGVIVVSFGSLVSRMPLAKAEVFARVFASLQQRVIWRYDGLPLKHKGENTLTVSWLPQNDLLGHNKTKIFVSHCGVSSSHEAINHAVPVVAVPLFVDQPYQATKLADKGMAVVIDYLSITEDDLRQAIGTVLKNYTTFKSNALKLSALMKDQPISMKEKMIYWVEYVIRQGHVTHLHPTGLKQLSWYQYYLLDILLFGVLVVVVSLAAVALLIKIGISCFNYVLCSSNRGKKLIKNE